MGKLRGEDGFYSHGQQESTVVLNSGCLVPQSLFIPIMLCCLVVVSSLAKADLSQPLGPRLECHLFIAVCMSMRLMMCVQGMNVLRRCVEVRGQLSQVSSPVSLIEARSHSALGALGWLPRELRVGSPVSASWDYRCTLLPLAFFHKSSFD